ncbi:MAG: IS1 family transposase [Prevotellaceae bacterium]|jgi:IS1 family transposase|nr:IS1 family transposase [Prevotellaceae bacterium]
MKCAYCAESCIKRGKRKDRQCYQCKCCKKYQQKAYSKPRIPEWKYAVTLSLHNKGMGVCALAEHLSISASSVLRVMLRLGKTVLPPTIAESDESYEIDELCTFAGNKKNKIWIIYAINRRTRQIVAFCVGGRTKKNLRKVVRTVLRLNPRRIYTDKLSTYKNLIEQEIHKIYPRCTNHIERKNLTLRTRLKRLGRRTICFNRSAQMLHNAMYLWVCGDPFVRIAA